MIAAPVQSRTPFQAADAPFDPRPPMPPSSEPGLLFVSDPPGRLCPRFGQDHALHPVRRGLPLVRRGVDAATPGEQAGRALDYPPMMVQARGQLRVLGRMTLQEGVATDEAALDRVQPEDVAEYGGLSGCACADDRGVGLEQAHPFFRCRHGFPLDDPSWRLRDHLAAQRDNLGQGRCQCLAPWGRLRIEDGSHVLGVLHGRLRDGEQALVCGAPPVSGRQATLPRCLQDPFHLAFGTARAIPQGVSGQRSGVLDDRLGCGQRPAEHPHAIVQQRAIGGGWIWVSTTVPPIRSVRPWVTWSDRAKTTTGSSRRGSVVGWIRFAYRRKVVSSGPGSAESRQNCRNTRISRPQRSVAS
jgi:hypothetical protein